jgi:DNA replication protein DnaC
MAKMHPETIDAHYLTETSIQIWRYLNQYLSDDFEVFCNYNTFEYDRDDVLHSFFIPFVIVHKKYGILILETVSKMQGNDLSRIKFSPYKKASMAQYAIITEYEQYIKAKEKVEISFKKLFDYQLTWAYAVAVPHSKMGEIKFGKYDDRAKTLASEDFLSTDLEDKLINYFLAERESKQIEPDAVMNDLTKIEVDKLINYLSLRTCGGYTFSDKLLDSEDLLDEINLEQNTILTQFSDKKKYLITGGAGTGKTWVATRKAVQCIKEGKSVALFCFNVELVKWINEKIREMTGDNSLTIARSVTKQLSNPELLSERFDVVIVDEAQDIPSENIPAIKSLVRDGGELYVFLDNQQDIFDKTKNVDYKNLWGIDDSTCLTKNLRNAKPVNEYIKKVTGMNKETESNRLFGFTPYTRSTSSSDKDRLLEFLDKNIKTYVRNYGVKPDQIAFVGNLKKENENSFLAGVNEIARIKITDTSAEDYVDNKNSIKYWTIQKFKGLEADIVFYFDYDKFDNEKRVVMAYTGLSRAKFTLTHIIINE